MNESVYIKSMSGKHDDLIAAFAIGQKNGHFIVLIRNKPMASSKVKLIDFNKNLEPNNEIKFTFLSIPKKAM